MTSETIDRINNIINTFRSISLEEMKSIRLMNRTDTKYVVNISILPTLLNEALNNYRIQEVEGERNIAYATVYYDTVDKKMYTAHQNGKKTREKIRMRSYVASNLSFLEIKNKNNRGRTDKKRIRIKNGDNFMNTEDTRVFLRKHAIFTPDELTPQLENNFSRITLVNNEMTERLTIDTGLRFHNITTNNDCALSQIAIIELKRDGRTPSPMYNMLLRMHIHTMGFSKYCIGSALTDPQLKQNLFKERIRTILKLNRITHE